MLRVSVCKEASWKKVHVEDFFKFRIFSFFFFFQINLDINFTACLASCTDRALQITSVCTELSALWDGMYLLFSLTELLIFQRARDWNLAK